MVKTIVQKILADKGLCSRREGERLVAAGKVKVNGITAKIGAYADPEKDSVTIDGVAEQQRKTTIALYKPRGVVSSKNNAEGKTVFDILPQYANLNIVGRLDKESEGLLILTDDGRVSRSVTGADHRIEKEYIVEVREDIFPGLLKNMEKGMRIDGKRTLPCKTAMRENRRSFTIILKEGKKHQIRRMCDACHLTVLSLKRIRIGSIRLEKLRPGNVRPLSDAEVKALL